MSRFEAEAMIGRAAEEVWAYAADVIRHPEWMTVADAQLLRGQGTEIGARGRERVLFGPFKWDVEFEVVDSVAGRRIVWRADDRRFALYEVGLDLEPTGATSTRATYRGAVQMRGLWRLLAPLIAMEGPAGLRRELERLKSNLEAAPAPAAAT
jgi:uncharacterized protein YndB with AHSA1/START domain